MKHLKQKLMAATAMLMVSAVMLTTSTYAWFAISTEAEVSDVSTTMTAYESLEIALANPNGTVADTSSDDDGSDTTWGATVGTNTSLDFDSTPIELPATYDLTTSDSMISTISYDTDEGRPSGYVAGAVTYSATTLGTGTITSTGSDAEVIGHAISFQLRTNTSGAISVTLDGIDSGTGVMVVVDGVYVDALTVGDEDVSTEIISAATANTEYEVELYVYYDGASASNEDVVSEIDLGFESATFENSAFSS